MANRNDFPQNEDNAASRLFTLATIVVVIAGLYLGRQMLIPLALAVIFSFLLTPLGELLEKCHLGRVPSVLAVLILSFALLAAIGYAVTNQLLEIVVRLPDYKENVHEKIELLRSPANGRLGKATATVNDLTKDLSAASETTQKNNVARNGPRQPIAVQVAEPPHNATQYLRDIVGPLTGLLETTAIVVILTLFMLVKREDLRNRFLRLAGRDQLHLATQSLDDASERLGRYLLLQFAVNASFGALLGLGTSLIGIPHPLLWGVLGFLLRFVPYIGTPIAAAFPMAMAIAIFPGWSQFGITFALYVVLELTIANFVEPWLYGSHTGVSSLAILVAAIFWSMLWGPVGLILSTPLTLCLIIMGSYIPQLRFLKILLGDQPVLSPPAHFYQRLLAFDDDDARQIAEQYLNDHPLENLYESVLIPALALEEQDRHKNALEEGRIKFIHQSVRELLEDLHDASPPIAVAGNLSALHPNPPASSAGSTTKMLCLPARDEADELIGIMVAQLLRRAGHDAQAVAIGPVQAMLDQVQELPADLVCVSALPPFAQAQARSLCKRLRQRYPNLKIFLGLWDFPGGGAKIQERGGIPSANVIGTSLTQIVSLMAGGMIPPVTNTETTNVPQESSPASAD
ncbi:MAG: AI-2E family transporter [Candidatus Sulfotelmatobacter sp.]